jgi:hypothetical protein
MAILDIVGWVSLLWLGYINCHERHFIFIFEFNRFRLFMVASSACGNEPSCYTKGQGILNKQSNCKVVKKTAP